METTNNYNTNINDTPTNDNTNQSIKSLFVIYFNNFELHDIIISQCFNCQLDI